MSEEQPWGESFFETADSVRIAVDVMLPLVEDKPSMRVLEVGCGNGAVANVLAAFGHNVTGIDASPSAIGAATANQSDATFAVAAPGTYFPAAGQGSFDLVVSAFGVPSPDGADSYMADIARHVRPGGRLMVIEWNSDMAERLRSPHYTFSPDALLARTAAPQFAAFEVEAKRRTVDGALDAADPRSGTTTDAVVTVLVATRREDDEHGEG